MHNAIQLSPAALMAVAIIVIGCFYLVSPERMTGSFGLKPPAFDAEMMGRESRENSLGNSALHDDAAVFLLRRKKP
jgi:hypothetical protein